MKLEMTIGEETLSIEATLDEQGEQRTVAIALSEIAAIGIENGRFLGATFTNAGAIYQIVGGIAPGGGEITELVYLAETVVVQ